jgi:monolysocardiolipin acyltransferase
MGLTGGLFKGFLNAFNEVEVIGLQRFLELLDSRKDIQNRQRGLITGALTGGFHFNLISS